MYPQYNNNNLKEKRNLGKKKEWALPVLWLPFSPCDLSILHIPPTWCHTPHDASRGVLHSVK
jgi:hypothetical protein